ncbi:MAG: FadR/GntR family transcriptional regulator [Oscillospiraceae bacterium]
MMFMENHDKADVEQLEQHFRRMRSASDDIKDFYLEDYMFHNTIAKGTKKVFIDNLSTALSSTLMQNPHHFVSPRIGLEYHDTILQYIKDGSADLAAVCIQRHIEATITAFKNNIERKTTLSWVR